MKRLQTLILMSVSLFLLSCEGNGQTAESDKKPVKAVEKSDAKSAVKIGEQFTLKTDESAKIDGTDIEITVKRIGRKWLANGGGESLDFTFSVKRGGKSETYSHPLPERITAGDYKIEVVKTEPFGYGYAGFVVTKIDESKNESLEKTDSTFDVANRFVGQFGWHIDDAVFPAKTALEFPNNFDGLPFYHYQYASLKSGIDMTPLSGKKVEVMKYALKEKQSDKGNDYTIFAHLIIENGKVVGAWRTDSSSRAPGIYSFEKR